MERNWEEIPFCQGEMAENMDRGETPRCVYFRVQQHMYQGSYRTGKNIFLNTMDHSLRESLNTTLYRSQKTSYHI
jgi:hypothetical protein